MHQDLGGGALTPKEVEGDSLSNRKVADNTGIEGLVSGLEKK